MYSAVIVDDETKARKTLRQMLNIYCPNVEVVAEADSVTSGYSTIVSIKPTVVFLDVLMPDGTGFDLLAKFTNPEFQVIIITAYEEYAIEAFKYSAIDYLLKPIDTDDLVVAVERLSRTVSINETRAKYSALSANMQNPKPMGGKLVLRTTDEAVIVDIENIIRCESSNNATLFYLNNSTVFKISKTLKDYDEMLSKKGFFRCHQSHLINKAHLVKVMRFPVPMAVMDDGAKVPISVRKQGLLK